ARGAREAIDGAREAIDGAREAAGGAREAINGGRQAVGGTVCAASRRAAGEGRGAAREGCRACGDRRGTCCCASDRDRTSGAVRRGQTGRREEKNRWRRTARVAHQAGQVEESGQAGLEVRLQGAAVERGFAVHAGGNPQALISRCVRWRAWMIV